MKRRWSPNTIESQTTPRPRHCGGCFDNILGVKGVGPKTASRLLKNSATAEEVYNSLAIIPEKRLKNSRPKGHGFDVQKLATVRDAPVDLKLMMLKFGRLISWR